MFRGLRRLAPLIACVIVALPWLNQGWSLAHTQAVRAAIDAGQASLAERVRYPVAFLYRRSADEEMYYADARAIRGEPYDQALLRDARGSVPSRFQHFPEADGRWHRPYAEVPIEYPAAILPVLLATEALFGGTFERFAHAFGWVMGACLLASAWLTTRAATGRRSAEGPGPNERTPSELGWALCALLLAQGGLAVQRLDGLLALCLAWAFAAVLGRRPGQVGSALGVAVALKFVPLLLVPPMLAVDRAWWRSGRARLTFAATFAGALVAGLSPMLFPPRALFEVLRYHGDRGLHVEALAGAAIALGRLAVGTATPSVESFGSYNLEGTLPAVLARASSPLMLAAVAVLTFGIARRPSLERPPDGRGGSHERADTLALAMLASMATVWVFGKVFSPQYLTWAMPFVLVVSGARGRLLTWLLVAAMAVTQLYLRGFYDEVTNLHAVGLLVLALRQALVLAFAVSVVRGLLAPASEALPLRGAFAARKG